MVRELGVNQKKNIKIDEVVSVVVGRGIDMERKGTNTTQIAGHKLVGVKVT